MMNNTEFWAEFIEIHKMLPETWQVKSDKYKNKILKNKAYEKLLNKLKEIEPNATIDAVKKKINNMRSSYRREFKKVINSEKSGAGTEDVYTPTLWYFDHLHFLKDQEEQEIGICSDDLLDKSFLSTLEEDQSPPKRIRKNHNSERERNNILQKLSDHIINSNTEFDEASTQAAAWEVNYRKLNETQKIYANKCIAEVLFQGALDKLTEYSYKCLEPTVCFRNSPQLPSYASSPATYSSSSNYQSTPSPFQITEDQPNFVEIISQEIITPNVHNNEYQHESFSSLLRDLNFS